MRSQLDFDFRKPPENGEKSDLSVIIVNWNVRERLLANLASLLEGNRGADFEVIVIDNASDDGSAEAVRSAFPHVRLIVNEKNLGFAAAVNQGLRLSRARHVLLLNPDMRLAPGGLEKIIKYLDANPGVAVMSGKLLDERGNAMHHMRRLPSFFPQLAVMLKLPHFFPGLLKHYHGEDLDLEKEQSVESVRGSLFAISGTGLATIGNFDEGFFIWFEEVDFCRRAKEAGCDVRYVPDVVAHDAVGKSFAQRNTYWKQKRFTASMIYYFKKWHPRWQSIILQSIRPLALGAALARDRMTGGKKPRTETASHFSAEDLRPTTEEANKLIVQVIAYRSAEKIQPMLDSLAAQTYRDFALRVFDNSEDEAEAEKLRDMLNAADLRHRLVVSEKNIGFAGGHTALFDTHRAPFVLLLNDDARLAPDCLEILMRKIEADQRIGSATGLIYRWDEETIDTTGLEYKCLAQIRDRHAGEIYVIPKAGEIFGVSGAVALYRRSAVEAAGGLFDPAWFMYKEDADLALRLKAAGYTAWFEPKAVGYHKRGLKQSAGLFARWKDERRRPKKLRIYAYANQLRIYRRHFSRSLGAKDILHSVAIELIRSVGTCIASPSVFFEAWKIAWKS